MTTLINATAASDRIPQLARTTTTKTSFRLKIGSGTDNCKMLIAVSHFRVRYWWLATQLGFLLSY